MTGVSHKRLGKNGTYQDADSVEWEVANLICNSIFSILAAKRGPSTSMRTNDVGAVAS